jgi:hypothetical protein
MTIGGIDRVIWLAIRADHHQPAAASAKSTAGTPNRTQRPDRRRRQSGSTTAEGLITTLPSSS